MDTAVSESVQQQPASTVPAAGDLDAPLLEQDVLEREVTPELALPEDVTFPDSTSDVGADDEEAVSNGAAAGDEELVEAIEDLSLRSASQSPETTAPTADSTEASVNVPEAKPEKTAKAQNNKVSSTTTSNKGDNRPDSTTKPAKSKKKEDKSIEHILRALNSLHSTEEKLAALCKKYADLHEEHRVLQASFKVAQRQTMVTSREKGQLQSEHTKAVMAKSKLESLCRELQKHNRIIKEESLARAREEDEKRREISNKFQQTIGEIQNQMTDNQERNVKLREDNTELAGKLQKFLEQYELREQQIEKIVQHRELEKQLGEAKLAQANAMLKELEERGGKEREFLLLQAAEAHKKSQVLETQLTMYKERYEEFQSTINRSNEMFGKFKTEMDKMGKRIKKLEKEGAHWKAKWEGSNRILIGMAEEKGKHDKEKGFLLTKVSKLESLCRALQSELHGKKPAPSPTATSGNDGMESRRDKGEPTATPPNTPETTSRNSPVKEEEEEMTSDSGETTPPVLTPSSPKPEDLVAGTTPAVATPAAVAPSETTSADVTPSATTPAAPTPVAPTPAAPTPADVTPAATTPADITPAAPTPADITTAAPTPAAPTPAGPTPAAAAEEEASSEQPREEPPAESPRKKSQESKEATPETPPDTPPVSQPQRTKQEEYDITSVD